MPGGLTFVPLTPCRVVDTRGAAGAFGAPELSANTSREFDLPQSSCGIPATAVAYSLNVTVVPDKILQYLTLWPSGQSQPYVSTLNSYDGRVKANAAITPGGLNGGVSVYVSDASNVILDIDGYFVPSGTVSALAFYPLAPCRVADTRGISATLGGPFIAGQSSRSFPVQSGLCNIPSNAQAYSLNVTALPHQTLNYLTAWPTGNAQPNVSTLNARTGAVTANAAIVPSGTSGAISIFVSDDADVILDVNGYFAPAAVGGLALYSAFPCRILDTRGTSSSSFSGVLPVPIETSVCAQPAAALAYVLNATVVPTGALNYLTLWPDTEGQPNVSTLNADDAAITSNMAIVPTVNGTIDAFSSDPTNFILDISSYFAPASLSPVANAGGPYSGAVGASISFSAAASSDPQGGTLSYLWDFGDSSTGTGVSPTHSYATAGTFTVNLTVTASGGGTATATAAVTITSAPTPTISGFSPASGPIGTVVTVSGSNLGAANGMGPQVTLSQQGGATLNAPVSTSSTTSLSFVIPPGAATGPISLMIGTQSVSSTSPFTVTTSSNFTVSATPGSGTLIQGQSAALAVTVNSANGFTGLAALAVTGLPNGVTASFQPSSVTSGQVSLLTLTAPASQTAATSTLTISAAAMIDGQSLTQSTTASLTVTAVSTSFLGRTVVDDAQETPIAGVTVKFLGVTDKGTPTNCTGQAVSDGGGNFMLAGLAANCVGPQLVSYDGSTASSPAGKYAGVNLSYTLVSGQVVSSPVLVHLPRIDDAETVQVQQNATTDQVFSFGTMPGVQVTVYAGTTLKLADGTSPNPFPLTAVAIPLDRLPEKISTSGMLMSYVVAFQPANAAASQPVAVVYPNALNVAPGTTVTLTTLDPTHGYMVPYGTATVSNDGRTVVPDMDPTHPGHRYGLVHFDWHTWLGMLIDKFLMALEHCFTCNPIDISTGAETYTTTDLQVRGGRGSMAIQRTYRTMSTNPGPFGIGTGLNYSMQLNLTGYLKTAGTILFITPNGNQYMLSPAADGTLLNGTIPALRGLVLTPNLATSTYNLRQLDGTVYTFQVFPGQGVFGAYLTSITDLNGNTTTLTLNPAQPLQVLKVTDPVGRSLALTYDGSNRITQITDPIGRIVKYSYNAQGTLASFTNANGGVTTYTYGSQSNVLTITDPRGVVTETNTYNEAGDGRVTQQVAADGGVTKFSYTLLNSTLADISFTSSYSPVLQTVVTDPLGHQTTYRFDTMGLLQSATDPAGQTTTLTHDATHNNLITSYKGAGVCVICGDRTRGDTSYAYDQFGNRLTQTDALGNTSTYTYDLRFNKVNSITDALGHATKLSYDSSGNLLLITDANGHQTQLAYDNLGEVTQVTDAAGAKTSVAYDSFGNIVSVTDALGHATALSYDAASRLTQVQDALGRKSTAAYDALDRVTSQTDPLNHTTSFSYDPVGDLLSYTDARNNSVLYAYDPIGRVHTRTSQLGKSETYIYDANSNLTQYTDRRGQASTFQYDPNNRLTQETYTDATVSRGYDANGRLLTVNDSQGGEFGFAYDTAGRLLTQGEPTGIVKYARDALGRVATRQVEGQGAVNYSYDPVGDMLTAATSAVGVTYQYDVRNLPTSLTRTNGVVTNYSYDQLGQVLSIIHSKGAMALNTQKYTYDAVGKRSAVSNDLSQPLITQSATSTVDKANELLTNGSTIYTYDANGNRLTETSSTGTLTYTWDGRNRLAAIKTSSGSTTSMQYDFTRNLLKVLQTSGASTTQHVFIVDSLTNVVSTTDSSGSPLSVLTGAGLDSHLASIGILGESSFGLADAINSVKSITDSEGRLVSRLFYEPYGQTSTSNSSGFPFAYTGRVSINGNIYYNRDRFYDTLSGRFISEDPIGLGSGPNQYVYANDDPINFSDPSGDQYITGENAASVLNSGLTSAAESATNCTNSVRGVAVGIIGSVLAAAAIIAIGPESVLAYAAYSAVAGGIVNVAQQYATNGGFQGFGFGQFAGSIVGSGLGGGYGKLFQGIPGILGAVHSQGYSSFFNFFGNYIGGKTDHPGSPDRLQGSCGCSSFGNDFGDPNSSSALSATI